MSTPATPDHGSGTYGQPPGQQGPQQGPPSYGQPPYAPVPQNPGKTFGIVGLVLAFFPVANIVGLVLSILGLRRSRKAGFGNVPAVVGIVVSILTIIGFVIFIAATVAVFGNLIDTCNELGPGTHVRDGVTYTCS